MTVSVCLSVCLSAGISPELLVRSSPGAGLHSKRKVDPFVRVCTAHGCTEHRAHRQSDHATSLRLQQQTLTAGADFHIPQGNGGDCPR